MEPCFPEIKKNFGFGMMRLPLEGEEVDFAQTCKMVDAFLEHGFNYFDTAHLYLKGQSEIAVKKCLTSRYPRDRYILTDKLSEPAFREEADILPLFRRQLERCGVDYFDFYLIHAVDADRYAFFTRTNAFETVQKLKAQGKIRHVGMSYHDSAELLDRILTEHPELEAVQLQLNYVDWEDPNVDSRGCYEVCCKHGKPVIVMEPVKGGTLVNLPEKALEMMTDYSPAGYAIRYAASNPQVFMVLSGMSDEAQMADNISTMEDFRPLTDAEQEMISAVRTLYQAQNRIPCTACHYCTDGCPMEVPIPELFACMNRKLEGAQDAEAEYAAFPVRADACVQCGQCEDVCPQHLHIRDLLREVDASF